MKRSLTNLKHTMGRFKSLYWCYNWQYSHIFKCHVLYISQGWQDHTRNYNIIILLLLLLLLYKGMDLSCVNILKCIKTSVWLYSIFLPLQILNSSNFVSQNGIFGFYFWVWTQDRMHANPLYIASICIDVSVWSMIHYK